MCWKCDSFTSYEECQQKLVISNCSSENSCFQLNVNLSKVNESSVLFSKGCLPSSSCEDYRRGSAGLCQRQRADGYNGACFGECCDGERCNQGDLLALSATPTASKQITTNKGTVFIISVMVLLSGLVLTVVNIG